MGLQKIRSKNVSILKFFHEHSYSISFNQFFTNKKRVKETHEIESNLEILNDIEINFEGTSQGKDSQE